VKASGEPFSYDELFKYVSRWCLCDSYCYIVSKRCKIGSRTRRCGWHKNSSLSIRKVSFLRVIAECFARLSHGLGVCLSVTLVNCIKTVQARITKFLPWVPTRSLVFRDKLSCPWVRGFPSNVILPSLARLV